LYGPSVTQLFAYTLDRHWLLPKLPIEQNHGIDNFTTLHTTFRSKLRLAHIAEYIQAEVLHHESTASGARGPMLNCRKACVIPELLTILFFSKCSCHDPLHRLIV
jgi:hypothetical protein